MRGRSPVEPAWTDAWGRRRRTPAGARATVIAAMGGDAELEDAALAVEVAHRGDIIRPGELQLEDGSELGRIAGVPRDLPHGYHRLRRGGRELLLVVAPRRCHLPRDMRTWGWAVQVYALRSHSWGIGDLADLRQLAGWSAQLGAGALLLSPLGAINPSPHPEPSPYYPSSRRFRNPLYLAVEEVPGFAQLEGELAALHEEGHELDRYREIDHARVQQLKIQALERIWERGGRDAQRDAEFVSFAAAQGEALRRWGLFAALSEELGPGWRTWPAALHAPDSPAARDAAQRLADRVAFHGWLQWLLDRQLRMASAGLRLMCDLPIGFDPGGFDAWTWQPLLARASLGAPPDVFNPGGQRWEMPPFVPHRLRRAGYRPLIETLRACLPSGGGLRIDHVLGIFRQWWVPDGAAPEDGAYVRQQTDELLAVLAIESERAGAVIIGEDLGTVPPGVRRRLAAANVLSTRLALFERRPPSRWPRRSLAAVTTHDLPTVAGVWSGIDLEDQRRSGVTPNAAGLRLLRRRLARVGGVPPDASLDEAVVAVHAAVSGSPSVLAVATLEDALRDPRRPNMPGTTPSQRDNWSRALPVDFAALQIDPNVRALASAMGRTLRQPD